MKKVFFISTFLVFAANVSFAQNNSNGINNVEEDNIFTVVEQMPEFPGGREKMLEFIKKNINYPKEELDKGVSGTCFLTFVVDKTGEIKNVKVLRGVTNGNLCNEEAVRVVKSMPKWIPGKQNGKETSVQYNLPIKFTNTNKQDKLVVQTPISQNNLKDSTAKNSVKKELVFSMVEQMPEFPGGIPEMFKFIQKNINYPTHGSGGTSYVAFVIDKTGEIIDVHLLRGVANCPACDDEALRLVKSMPKWKPGKQNGKEVSVQYNLPIKFEITDKNKESR